MHNIKKIILKIAEIVVSNNFLWKVLSSSMIRGSYFLCSVRNNFEVEQIVNKHPTLRDALSEKTVISGPFKGMKYGSTKAFCSALFPKLLGVYENELTNFINCAINKGYNTIVDVGAADGYYAVGFALKNINSRVIAYEMDSRARIELTNLSLINNVLGRVEIREKCIASDLLNLDGDQGLIIMDCEGYEEHLLTPDVINRLATWDFIIETHDGYSTSLTSRLTERFTATHTVINVDVIHDLNKADHVYIPILKDIPRRDLDKLLAESRQHACLRWIICYSNLEFKS